MLSAIEDYLQTGLDEIMKVGLTYYMSEKSWPNLYIKLLYEIGQDFLDKQ